MKASEVVSKSVFIIQMFLSLCTLSITVLKPRSDASALLGCILSHVCFPAWAEQDRQTRLVIEGKRCQASFRSDHCKLMQ